MVVQHGLPKRREKKGGGEGGEGKVNLTQGNRHFRKHKEEERRREESRLKHPRTWIKGEKGKIEFICKFSPGSKRGKGGTTNQPLKVRREKDC